MFTLKVVMCTRHILASLYANLTHSAICMSEDRAHSRVLSCSLICVFVVKLYSFKEVVNLPALFSQGLGNKAGIVVNVPNLDEQGVAEAINGLLL